MSAPPDPQNSLAYSNAQSLQAGMYRYDIEEILKSRPSTLRILLRVGTLQDESWRFPDGSALVLTFECVGPDFSNPREVLLYEEPMLLPKDKLLEWRMGSFAR